MHYVFSWPVVFLYSSYIIFISVIPLKIPELLISPYSDKILHFLAYAVLSFIVVNTFKIKNEAARRMYSFFYSFGLGLFLEFIQFFLPYRSFEVTDIAVNLMASLLGCFLKF